MKIKNKALRVILSLRPAFYLAIVALVLVAVGLSLHVKSYNALGYVLNRFTILYSVTTIALMAFVIVNSVVAGNNKFSSVFIFAGGAVFSLFAGLLHIRRTRANIGVYFTANIGNAEANAAGVPPAIAGAVMYVIASVVIVAAAFFRPVKDGGSVLEILSEGKEERHAN